MKLKPIFFVLFILINIIGCVSQQNSKGTGNTLIKKEGIIIFAPILNTSYFFPFKDNPTDRKLENFVDYIYDSGFIIYWTQENWRNSVLDDFSKPIPNNNIYKAVALASIEYYPSLAHPSDSLYSLAFEYSGVQLNYQYDDNDRVIESVKGLK